MKAVFRSLALLVALSVVSAPLLASPEPAPDHKKKGKKSAKVSVTIVNKSKWELHHFFLTFWDERSWGPDQLGKNVIKPGGSFTLEGIECDTYDVRLIDEDGDECIVEDVDLCLENEKWVITDKDLLKCQARS